MADSSIRYVLVAVPRKGGVGVHKEIKAIPADQLPDGVGFKTRAELKRYLATNNVSRPRIEESSND